MFAFGLGFGGRVPPFDVVGVPDVLAGGAEKVGTDRDGFGVFFGVPPLCDVLVVESPRIVVPEVVGVLALVHGGCSDVWF